MIPSMMLLSPAHTRSRSLLCTVSLYSSDGASRARERGTLYDIQTTNTEFISLLQHMMASSFVQRYMRRMLQLSNSYNERCKQMDDERSRRRPVVESADAEAKVRGVLQSFTIL
jgi:hypothetical protein